MRCQGGSSVRLESVLGEHIQERNNRHEQGEKHHLDRWAGSPEIPDEGDEKDVGFHVKNHVSHCQIMKKTQNPYILPYVGLRCHKLGYVTIR